MTTRLQAILARRTSEIKQHADELAERQARKRAAFPVVASLVDDIRRDLSFDANGVPMGEPIKSVPYGIEPDGKTFGRLSPRGETPVLERMPTKDAAPARVNKGRPPHAERWWENTETEDC